jgi:uncharacterized protein YceK
VTEEQIVKSNKLWIAVMLGIGGCFSIARLISAVDCDYGCSQATVVYKGQGSCIEYEEPQGVDMYFPVDAIIPGRVAKEAEGDLAKQIKVFLDIPNCSSPCGLIDSPGTYLIALKRTWSRTPYSLCVPNNSSSPY